MNYARLALCCTHVPNLDVPGVLHASRDSGVLCVGAARRHRIMVTDDDRPLHLRQPLATPARNETRSKRGLPEADRDRAAGYPAKSGGESSTSHLQRGRGSGQPYSVEPGRDRRTAAPDPTIGAPMAFAGLWGRRNEPEAGDHRLDVHDHNRPAKRACRADPQPDAGDPAARRMASVVGRRRGQSR